MSNANAPSGLKPVRMLNGSPWNGALMQVAIESGYNAALYVGDAVVWVKPTSTTLTVPSVQKATAGSGNKIFGVICGFDPVLDVVSPNNNISYHPAATFQYAYVCIPNGVVFQIQGSTDAALDATYIGYNANLIDTHSGSTSTGFSGTELDTATAPSADATKQLTIVGASTAPNNDVTAAHCKWEVMINLPSLFPGIVGV